MKQFFNRLKWWILGNKKAKYCKCCCITCHFYNDCITDCDAKSENDIDNSIVLMVIEMLKNE